MNPENSPETGTDDPADRPGPSPLPDRYGTLSLDDDHVVVYDCENVAAWVETTDPVPLGGGVDG
ncbi:MAG: DUF7331 family protein [Halolamina sp.]